MRRYVNIERDENQRGKARYYVSVAWPEARESVMRTFDTYDEAVEWAWSVEPKRVRVSS